VPDSSSIHDKMLLEPVNRVFSKSVKIHGSKPKAVAWNNQEKQFRRFQIFAGLFPLIPSETSFSINDLGCGYGAMFAAYKDLPEFKNGSYYGYDISIEMLLEAKKHLDDPRASWIQSHLATEEADFSFVSGTYNLNMDADKDQWRTYIENNLLQLWSKTRLALGFNMLSAHSPKRQKTLYYADPEHFLAFCTKNMNGRVQLVNRLAPEEFVIFILRKESLKNSNG
tara:strand:+ start:449 stop:1123 length:675 start_codon:yes stop_codon:yes gene_type:complete